MCPSVQSRRRLLAVSLIGAAIVAFASAATPRASLAKDTEVSSEVLRLAMRFEYERIVALGSQHRWKHGADPEVLMTYSRALLETGREIPDALRTPHTRKNVALFVEAYTDLIRGHVNRAESAFLSLTNSGDAKSLGCIGLLEQSTMLRDFPAMHRWLANCSKEPALARHFPWVVPHYTASYLSGAGSYRELAQLLERPQVAGQLRLQTVAVLQADILVRRNEFSEAHAVIDSAIAKSGLDPDLAYVKATVISAEKGLRSALEYLKASRERLPEAWVLEFHEVLHEAEAGLINPVQTAKALVPLGFSRTFDAAATIAIASALEDLGATPISDSLVSDLSLPVEDLRRYATYNIWLAKTYLRKGRTQSLDLAFRRAQQMDPANPDLLWLEYAIARARKNHEGALGALAKLLELDPNNKPALQAATRVHEEMRRWSDVIVLGKRFLQSKRVTSSNAEQEVRDRVQRAMKVSSIPAK